METFAGPVFAWLRRSLGTSERDYQQSLANPQGCYLQFISNSKSKADFFLTWELSFKYKIRSLSSVHSETFYAWSHLPGLGVYFSWVVCPLFVFVIVAIYKVHVYSSLTSCSFRNDKRFFLKTQNKREVKFLLSNLKIYLEHLERYPHSLLVKFLGATPLAMRDSQLRAISCSIIKK